ncbi:uncharacterized protein CBL_07804 [Carabus blaptoides fortunei]
MSLFPAYADTQSHEPQSTVHEQELSFASYKIDPPVRVESLKVKPQKVHASSSSSESDTRKKSKHKKSSKRHKSHHKLESTRSHTDYVTDTSRELVFLKVTTISRPAAPKYRPLYRFTIGDSHMNSRKKKKVYRYYNSRFIPVTNSASESEDVLGEVRKCSEDKNVPQSKAEDDISRKTAFYNQSLGKDPFDVDLWLQYIKFQDNVWLFEKTYKKGSIAKGGRVTGERKLSILDKALAHNLDSEALSRERVLIAETVYPGDELSVYLRKFVDKHPSNIILWQGYIEATQCSMAHCTTPAVIAMYNRCLSKLHQLRRASSLEKSSLEQSILSMLYQCCLFLRQAGLWEQLWTLLQLYLELNLDRAKFNTNYNACSETQLVALEEVILESQLPLHELWLRVEKLRESCHWLPWKGAEPCEDPQRLVFVDDVTDLIHPITSAGNTFRLTVTVLTLLKTPLLPCRHSTMHDLGLDYVPWALDSIESLFPVFYPLYPVDLRNECLLMDAPKLAVGPQYFKTHPGQEEYLDFLTNLMRNCADSLQSAERTAIYVWWMRFERLLIRLDKEQRFKMPVGRNKKVRSSIKEFLKDELNRNNVIFYREYALIEFELANFDSARKILLTAVSMLTNGNAVTAILDATDRAAICSLYRTLIELYLTDLSGKNKALLYLYALVNGNSVDAITNEHVAQLVDKFQQISVELLRDSHSNLSVAEHFLPDYLTDFVICYGWLLYLVRTPFEAGAMIENTLGRLEDDSSDCVWRREVLLEWYVTIFYKTCSEELGCGIYGLFNDILHKALTQFPNNLYLLAVASKEQSSSGCVGKPWWKLSNLLSGCGHAMPALFLVVMASQQLTKLELDMNDSSSVTLGTLKNRIQSLFTRLTQSEMCTKRCGLLWRLYLQHLYAYSDSGACRKAYYAAVDECPWLKALYIDAAIFIPAELPQIQDLIIEKQLRIHVTPEELDVLRL